MYLCMYVIFIRCDRRTSNNKHESSQNDIQYRAETPPPKKKLFQLTKLRIYKQRIRRYECPRVLKLTQFLAGGSKWFKACAGVHNTKQIMIGLIHKFFNSHTILKITKTLQTSNRALIQLTSSTGRNPPDAGRAYKRRQIITALAITDSRASGRP